MYESLQRENMTERLPQGAFRHQASSPSPPFTKGGKGKRPGSLGNTVLRLVFVPMFFEPHKVLKIRALQEGVGGTFVADGRGGLGTVIVAGVDFHTVIELHDDLEQAVELIFRALPLGKRATNTPDEQSVASD